MADDARISCALPSHPKTRKLRRRIGAPACWSLVCLFLWTANNRWDGNLSGLSDEDIELASEWEGEPGVFVQMLCEVGFLDGEAEEHKVHDWAEHNPWAASRGERVESAKRAAAARWGSAMRGVCGSDAGRMRNSENRNAHHPTQPTPNPNQKTSSSEVGTSDKGSRAECSSSKERKAKSNPSHEAEQLASLLQSEILRNKPDYRITPSHSRQWAATADRMLRLDKRSPEAVANLIRWVQQDEFWRANVLSMDKLREKYDQLEMRREAANNAQVRKHSQHSSLPTDYNAGLTTLADGTVSL